MKNEGGFFLVTLLLRCGFFTKTERGKKSQTLKLFCFTSIIYIRGEECRFSATTFMDPITVLSVSKARGKQGFPVITSCSLVSRHLSTS